MTTVSHEDQAFLDKLTQQLTSKVHQDMLTENSRAAGFGSGPACPLRMAELRGQLERLKKGEPAYTLKLAAAYGLPSVLPSVRRQAGTFCEDVHAELAADAPLSLPA